MTSPQGTSRPHRLTLIDRAFAFVEARPPFDRFLLKLSLLVFLVSGIYMLLQINKAHLVDIPHSGGTLTEGIVGTPRFANPLLAVTNADKDIVALVYAGLMKLGPSGGLVPDMAESVTISDDGLTYSVTLKSGLTFHDGSAVTADDVIFTITRIVDPALKSPLLGSWEGVTVERVSDRELNLILQKPYAPFLENLTVGILPKHIWEDATADAFPFSQYNSEPVGSGPYRINNIVRSKSGIPESYILVPFEQYSHEVAKIARLTLMFYSNEESLINEWKKGTIESAAGLSTKSIAALLPLASSTARISAPLPRTFAVFFNQNEAPLFRDKAVREALALVTDRAQLVREVLHGSAFPVTGPIPPQDNMSATSNLEVTEATLDIAREMLREDGWRFDGTQSRWQKNIGGVNTPLAFTLATANTETLEKTAEMLRVQWEKIGVAVTLERYEQVDLTQSVIRPRKFQALLFGTVIGRELDFYPFWHSSQRNDPGLNVALYANLTTDSILADARTTRVYAERIKKNEQFAAELMKDVPAIFLYAPIFTYLVPSTVQNISTTGITEPSERFSSINDWHVVTQSVWNIFTRSSS